MAASSTPPHFTAAFAKEDNSQALLGVSITFIILEVGFVALRYHGRTQTKEKVGFDDILMVPSLLTVLASPALMLALIEYGGAGHHTAVVLATSPSTYAEFNKIQLAIEIMYFMGVTFPKLAVLSLLSRVFIQRWFRYACCAVAAILTVSAIVNTVIACLMCRPLAALWDPTLLPTARCLDLATFYRWSSLPNIITDLAMLALPIPAVANMHLALSMKVKLVATFAAGGLGIAVSIVRFVTYWRLDLEHADIVYISGTIGIYTVVETGGYLISACLLNFRKFLPRPPKGFFSRSYLFSRFRAFSSRGGSSKRTTEASAPGHARPEKVGPPVLYGGEAGGAWYEDTIPLRGFEGAKGGGHVAYAERGREGSDGVSSRGRDDGGIRMCQDVDVTAGP